jgi:hypothetical protein
MPAARKCSGHYASRGCPSYPTCANILKDPVYWTTDFYAIGAPEIIRLYLATIGSNTDRHTLVISLDVSDPAGLERLRVAAAPIVASIRFPGDRRSINRGSMTSCVGVGGIPDAAGSAPHEVGHSVVVRGG